MTLIDNLITKDLKAAALGYATKGWFVFPVHHPDNDRRSCRNPNCPSPAKPPITTQGLKNATTDPGTLDVWWSRCPNANIGIVTGRVSGIVVEDVDAKSGGLETWAKLQDIQGRVDTLAAVTGVGGGYIVAPAWVHISGDRYGRE